MKRDPAELFHDMAVFQRTAAGRQEMLRQPPRRRPLQMKLLAVVNGYTSLRDLLELGFGSADVLDDLRALIEDRLIELAEPRFGLRPAH